VERDVDVVVPHLEADLGREGAAEELPARVQLPRPP
jgi:hypothetical protein